jgi:hypothetical protein
MPPTATLGDHCLLKPLDEGYILKGCDLRINLRSLNMDLALRVEDQDNALGRAKAGMIGQKVTVTPEIWERCNCKSKIYPVHCTTSELVYVPGFSATYPPLSSLIDLDCAMPFSPSKVQGTACHCPPDKRGIGCEFTCPKDSLGRVCAGNGTCTIFGDCECNPGQKGEACEFGVINSSFVNVTSWDFDYVFEEDGEAYATCNSATCHALSRNTHALTD